MVACCSMGPRITSGRRHKTIVKAKVRLLLSYDYTKSGKRQKTIVQANIFETIVVGHFLSKSLPPIAKLKKNMEGQLVLIKQEQCIL